MDAEVANVSDALPSIAPPFAIYYCGNVTQGHCECRKPNCFANGPKTGFSMVNELMTQRAPKNCMSGP
jgi:hypothetical protein